ncbi:hypothetical protein E1B28_002103 [Marasmius oreades]|uniref:Uncharacterized protein n=1 Tax=Marasmius oreades TaxID=181124 RepID=A0A9P7RM26_9AGAR|nr:uncharacterized protein E1B28_002103 [Marasmius oreades]KAG7086144.1 hypothetical protein E1B28_002103 [Marasmius oreades]
MSSTSELEQALAPFLSAEPNPVHRLYKGGNIVLFILATIYTSVDAWGISRQAFIDFHAATTKDYTLLIPYLNGDNQKAAWGATRNIISTLMKYAHLDHYCLMWSPADINNLSSIADTMLIYRCYLIFNSNKLVLFLLVLAASVLNGIDLGCIIVAIIGYGNSSKPENIHLRLKASFIDNGAEIGIAVFQIILTFLTGGRIWWITRQARQSIRGSTYTRYNDIVAIIVESGLLYAGSLLTAVVINLVLNPQTGIVPFDFLLVSALMSGLAPTIVIARMAYGKSVENVQQTISTSQVADVQVSQQTQQTGTRQAINNFQLQTQPGITVNDTQGVEETSAIPTVEKV